MLTKQEFKEQIENYNFSFNGFTDGLKINFDTMEIDEDEMSIEFTDRDDINNKMDEGRINFEEIEDEYSNCKINIKDVDIF